MDKTVEMDTPAGGDCKPRPETLTVRRVAEANLPTEHGDFRIIGYRSTTSEEEFVAVVKGELTPDEPTLVRIHSQCFTGDVLHSLRCDCGQQLQRALERIEEAGAASSSTSNRRGAGSVC